MPVRLAQVIDYHHRLPFSRHFGDGSTSSSDGQYFRAGGRGEAQADVNAHYGNDPGVKFYTHISDQGGPYRVKVISATESEALHVVDGLRHHESERRSKEHYADTGAVSRARVRSMPLAGQPFRSRIRNLKDRSLFTFRKASAYPVLGRQIGGQLNEKHMAAHWDKVLRLTTSIETGTVPASQIMRKLASYPRQNGLAVALREIGRLERTFDARLDRGPRPPATEPDHAESRRIVQFAQACRVHSSVGRTARPHAGESAYRGQRPQPGRGRHHPLEHRIHRPGGNGTASGGHCIPDEILPYLSPLMWEHINLTGDYVWNYEPEAIGKNFLPLRLSPQYRIAA